jgi:hypothetical protein
VIEKFKVIDNKKITKVLVISETSAYVTISIYLNKYIKEKKIGACLSYFDT